MNIDFSKHIKIICECGDTFVILSPMNNDGVNCPHCKHRYLVADNELYQRIWLGGIYDDRLTEYPFIKVS